MKYKSVIRLYLKAGQATPAPPVSPALGQHGLNIMEFCRKYNELTSSYTKGILVPVMIYVQDKVNYTIKVKTRLLKDLILEHAKLSKGGAKGCTEIVGSLSKDSLREIAEIKLKDLHTNNIDSAMSMIEGSAKSMGIVVK